jgi:hypothetical protein
MSKAEKALTFPFNPAHGKKSQRIDAVPAVTIIYTQVANFLVGICDKIQCHINSLSGGSLM